MPGAPAHPRAFVVGTLLVVLGASFWVLTLLWMGSFIVQGHYAITTLFFTAIVATLLFIPAVVVGWYLRSWSRSDARSTAHSSRRTGTFLPAWEYAVVVLRDGTASIDYLTAMRGAESRELHGRDAEAMEILSELGRQGWELAAIDAGSPSGARDQRLFFKRAVYGAYS